MEETCVPRDNEQVSLVSTLSLTFTKYFCRTKIAQIFGDIPLTEVQPGHHPELVGFFLGAGTQYQKVMGLLTGTLTRSSLTT